MKKITKIFSVFLATLVLLTAFSSCSNSEDVNTTFESPYSFDFGTVIKAEITVKNFGKISLDLYPSSG